MVSLLRRALRLYRPGKETLENLKKAEENFGEIDMDYWLNRTQEVLERL